MLSEITSERLKPRSELRSAVEDADRLSSERDGSCVFRSMSDDISLVRVELMREMCFVLNESVDSVDESESIVSLSAVSVRISWSEEMSEREESFCETIENDCSSVSVRSRFFSPSENEMSSDVIFAVDSSDAFGVLVNFRPIVRRVKSELAVDGSVSVSEMPSRIFRFLCEMTDCSPLESRSSSSS